MVAMDIPNPDQATEIARSYLKELGSTKDGIQKPSVQAWLEVERRLNLSDPGVQTAERKAPTPRASAITPPKKEQSIWKRPISELWR
jgi:hypothetical protein